MLASVEQGEIPVVVLQARVAELDLGKNAAIDAQ
jgi:hypothetical protein